MKLTMNKLFFFWDTSNLHIYKTIMLKDHM